MDKRSGILAAGNWIIDHVKVIDRWPEQDGIACIIEQSEGNGGFPYNILKDLAKLEPALPLAAAGLLGDDANGRHIIRDCQKDGIDTSRFQFSVDTPTSYTDVMTVRESGRRTFFHQRGSNALLSSEHIDLETSSAKIFAMGYFGLLDSLDALDENGKNGHVAIFEQASNLGMITCADLTSVHCDFPPIVNPSLPHIDILMLNEWEATQLTGMESGSNDLISISHIELQAREILTRGVRRAVAIHFSTGVVVVSASGKCHLQGALNVPSDCIRGAAGAGDAFCAGFLYGIHEDWSLPECSRLGVCTAGASLGAATCSDTVRPWDACLELGERWGYKVVCEE
ncbi:carbohydrate kinase family protein [Rubellicoccus peritrichatus]|uniref:Carbohydrate kinase family protein n=1 Tax=Rubellicoccus peritrichatus TaxID=3080537 RepID=A0AAQ3L640_9BACT|nr:carbohydrate kinase family protein [Puniceicoccus sp. CR14]WOO39606.1 carbohydrate kinase family protein [Puniceicoccus sp. CR14]